MPALLFTINDFNYDNIESVHQLGVEYYSVIGCCISVILCSSTGHEFKSRLETTLNSNKRSNLKKAVKGLGI